MLKKSVIPSVGLCLLNTVHFSCSNNTQEEQKPNFIFIFADNLGYGDLGYTGSQLHRTPNIDNMAKEGIALTSLYSSSPVSTPSRASLMTGCYAQRVGMHLNEHGGQVLRPISPVGLNSGEITIADLLREQGYATACIGKWHLGDQPGFLPLNHGFDYFYGIPYSEDMVPSHTPSWPALPLVQNNKVIEAPVDLTTSTRRYVGEAINFITENKERPFFLYFPHNLPGSLGIPIVDDRFRGKSANGAWGDSIEEIDWSVGEIINALEKLGLDENTMIIFTSDNGAPGTVSNNRPHVGSNEPFSGPGYSIMEGGMRMPTVVQWTGTIPPGITSNELTTMMDWLPTFAYLAGIEPPGDRIIDGKNIWPILSGDKNAKSPHEVFFYFRMDQLQAVREGNWKLHLALDNKYLAGNINSHFGPSEQVLINLDVDLEEKHDLSDLYPEVASRLLKHAEKITMELGNPIGTGEQVRPSAHVENPKPLLLE